MGSPTHGARWIAEAECVWASRYGRQRLEWVEDTWYQNYDGAPTDGSAWLRGVDPSYRVVRGGSWRNETECVRAAARFRRNINVRFDTLGFRVARTITP